MKTDKLVEELVRPQNWHVMFEDPKSNEGAFAIAQSVVPDGRYDSYVSQG